jgi:hypothetical protein
MAQLPFQVDVLQVEPGSGQTLKITRDAPTGSLRFWDVLIPLGINLSDLASLNAITGVLVVGRAGSGAKYLTIQSAINAIPSTASVTNPYMILVFPGIYLENLVIDKDGVSIVAVGLASIVAVSSTPTVTIKAGLLTTPLTALFQGIKIQTSFVGLECVLVQGGPGSAVANGGVIFKDCNFAALGAGGYTVRADTVNSVTLYGCRTDESVPSATQKVTQCASYLVSGGTVPPTQMDYDTVLPPPATAGSTYSIENGRTVGAVLSTLSNAGSLRILDCLLVGNVTLNGNRTGLIQSSTVGNLSIGGTSAMTLVSSKRGTVAGTGTLEESGVSGSTSFVASLSEAVVFAVPRPNANYAVMLDTGVSAASAVTLKTAAGFTITFGAIQTTTVYWTVSSV